MERFIAWFNYELEIVIMNTFYRGGNFVSKKNRLCRKYKAVTGSLAYILGYAGTYMCQSTDI